jgi:hypothetical protein
MTWPLPCTGSSLVLRLNQETIPDVILLFLPPCGTHLIPFSHRVHRAEPTCLSTPLRPHKLRPFTPTPRLHQRKSSSNLHLQYSARVNPHHIVKHSFHRSSDALVLTSSSTRHNHINTVVPRDKNPPGACTGQTGHTGQLGLNSARGSTPPNPTPDLPNCSTVLCSPRGSTQALRSRRMSFALKSPDRVVAHQSDRYPSVRRFDAAAPTSLVLWSWLCVSTKEPSGFLVNHRKPRELGVASASHHS